MKVSSIASVANYQSHLNKVSNSHQNNVTNNYSLASQPLRAITFGGNKIQDQVALVTSEVKPYFQVGGVATVVVDYPGNVFGANDKSPIIMPLYNCDVKYNSNGTKIESTNVFEKNGVPVFINDKNKQWELELVAKKDMDWNGKTVPIAAYKVKDQPHYMIYNPATAEMPKPYQKRNMKVAYGTNSVAYGTDSVAYGTNSKSGNDYAQFSKALVELLPDLQKTGVNPKHLVLNDAQVAYVPEFIGQQAEKGNDYYKDTTMSFVQHNLGDGYQQILDNETMFRSFADNDLISAVQNDPVYKKAKLTDAGRGHIDSNKAKQTEKYFKPLVTPFIRTDGKPVASMIPIRYAQANHVNHISGVSELYAKDCIDDPRLAVGLTPYLKELAGKGKMSGILNGMNNKDIDPTKVCGLPNYKTTVTDNLGNIHKPFETYNANMPIGDIIATKNKNKINLINRLQKGVDKMYSISHQSGKAIIGDIDPKWADKIKNGEDVTMFVFWGRSDDQKGADNVLEAFSRFAKTPEGKNSILVAGGELTGQSAEPAIRTKLKEMSDDNDLKGRFAFMDGFAPNAILSSAGDAAIFPSRWAPCELTDLEAMKYGATPIVTNIQGLKQKNFDARNPEEAQKATGYKTDAHFFMSEKDVQNRSEMYNKEMDRMVNETLNEYNLDSTETNKEVAEKIVKGSQEYRFLWRDVTDELTTQDLVKAMSAKVTESPETRAKLIKNCMHMKSGWQNNQELHPEGNKSSQNLYYDRHVNGTSTPITESMMLKGAENYVSQIKERAGNNLNFSGWQTKVAKTLNTATDAVREFMQKKANRNLAGGILAGTAILGTAAGTVAALNKNSETEKPHASAMIA